MPVSHDHEQKPVKVRASLRLRNDTMIAARDRLHLAQLDVDRVAGVPIGTCAAFEKFHFRDGTKSSISLANRISAVAGVLEMAEEDVAPVELRGHVLESDHERRFAAQPISLLEAAKTEQLLLDDSTLEVDERLDAESAREALLSAMKTLSYREREILKLRFGLTDGNVYTVSEVAHIFKVTKGRIFQVEKQAMRVLASRFPQLCRFLPGWEAPKQKAEDAALAASAYLRNGVVEFDKRVEEMELKKRLSSP